MSHTIKDLLDKMRALHSKSENTIELASVTNDIEILFEKLNKEHGELQSCMKETQNGIEVVWSLIHSRESLIQAILGASRDIILTINSEKQIVEFNHSAEVFFDVPKTSIQGKSILTLISGGSLLDDLKTIFNRESPVDLDYFGKLHERSLILNNAKEICISIFPNKIISGNETLFTLYLHDLTNQKITEKLLDESRAQMMLASKFSALGEMAGGIAHEINTPLATIQMRAEQLLERLADNEIDVNHFRSSISVIDRTVRRIAKIVQGLRAFARDGKMDPFTPNSVLQIIEDSFSLCREKFYHHGVNVEVDSKLDLQIHCRPNEISQVILNLLNNAYDAISNNQEKWVRVKTECRENKVYIFVTDSGIGIPLDIQNKIMQPFFTTKEVGKGTGLGLSISRGIIEAHNGQIFIDNTSQNTTFCISLPLHQNL